MYVMSAVWIFTCLQKSLCATLFRSVSPLDWEQMAGSDWTAAGDDSVTLVSQSDYFAECCGRSFLANASWPRVWQTLVMRRLVSAIRFNEPVQKTDSVVPLRSCVIPDIRQSGSGILHSGIWSKIFHYSHMYIHITVLQIIKPVMALQFFSQQFLLQQPKSMLIKMVVQSSCEYISSFICNISEIWRFVWFDEWIFESKAASTRLANELFVSIREWIVQISSWNRFSAFFKKNRPDSKEYSFTSWHLSCSYEHDTCFSLIF